ncbi:M28 family peptidase [candidate division GN15 bacterium]|nr:M28 family peptidase [candidate division GN15 bacterium]
MRVLTKPPAGSANGGSSGMSKLLLSIGLLLCVSLPLEAADLYRVVELDADQTDALAGSGVEPVLRLNDGYLVLAEAKIAEALKAAGLSPELVAGAVSIDELAIDLNWQAAAIEGAELLHEDGGVRFYRVESGMARSELVVRGLKPVADLPVRISVGRSVKVPDVRASKDLVDLETLIAEISQDSLESYIGVLESHTPRNYGAAGNYASRDWLVSKLTGYGYDSVVLDSFTYFSTPCQNVVAYKVGTTFPDHHIVVGAHRDAVPSSPGADDNGSGTAAVLEIARVLADVDLDQTMVFVLFDAEEVGLIGSEHYVDEAVANGDSITMMFNMDMIANEGNANDAKLYHGSQTTFCELFIDLADSLMNGFTGHLWGSISASDHYPFQQAGIEVVMLHEYIFSSVYHSPDDDSTHMDFPYCTKMTQGALATVYTISQTAGPQPGVNFAYPGGMPLSVHPESTTVFQVEVLPYNNGAVVDNSGELHYRVDGGSLMTTTMTQLSPGVFEATLPVIACSSAVSFYVSAEEETRGRLYGEEYEAVAATEVPEMLVDGFESDQGWTLQGQWQWGAPQGSGGSSGDPDPSTARTGQNVLGYNLAGDYANGLSEQHATSPAIDCSNSEHTTLKFWRWLGVERNRYDHAYLRISTDGTTWTTLWENPDTQMSDGAWVAQEFDISAIADGEPTVYIRFTMGSSDGSVTYCGWNVDDLMVYGYSCQVEQSCCVADRGNVDGSPDDAVSLGDLTVLVDNLFISLDPIDCWEEANVDESQPEGPTSVTLGDLTVLVDHLFISLSPLPACP